MPCDDCMNRREFLAKSAGVTVAAAIVVGCGNGQFGPDAPISAGANGLPTDGAKTVKVGSFAGLATVGTLVEVANLRAAKRVKSGSATDAFVAYSLICTHQGCAAGVQGGTQIFCPCHGSRFDANGNVINGPATRSLPQITPVTYDPATDQLTIP